MKSVVNGRIVSAPISTLAVGECNIDENTVPLLLLLLPLNQFLLNFQAF